MHIFKMTIAAAFFIAAAIRAFWAFLGHTIDVHGSPVAALFQTGSGALIEGLVSLVAGAVLTLWLDYRSNRRLERARFDKR
jgi:hypothetical protein